METLGAPRAFGRGAVFRYVVVRCPLFLAAFFFLQAAVIRSLSMADTKRERRSGERRPVRVPVSVKASHEGIATTGVTRDLSAGGVFLYTDSRISEGSELEMVLIMPSEITKGERQWVCFRASVVRVEDSQEGGSLGVAASIRSMEFLPEIPS